MSIRKGNTLIAGNAAFGYRPPLLQSFWSDHILNRVDLLRADTFSWQSGKMYKAVYKELVSEYDNVNSVEEIEYIKSNINVVGSITDKKGVLTGFTASNYATVDIDTVQTTDLIEFVISFNTGTWSDTTNSACGVLYGENFPELQIYNQKANLGSNPTTGTYTYSTNEDVTWKISIQNGTVNVYRLTGDNEFELDYTVPYANQISGTILLGASTRVTSRYLANGSINLNECYINVNGSRWWRGTDGITFKRTPNGYKIADSTQETAILNKYNTDGIAWIYILNKGNTQFKLPRTKFGFEGARDSVGNDIAESLPQHSHSFTQYLRAAGGSANIQLANDGYNAVRSYEVQVSVANNPVYQDNAPVQERATQMYLYFYVGNYTQSAIEQTAGLNAELFNNKADKVTVEEQLASKQDKCIHIIDTYTNGTSGYRIWSDGYCEQWGKCTTTSNSWVTVTFLKVFKDTSYTPYGGVMVGDTSASSNPYSVAFKNATTTSIQTSIHDNESINKGTWTWKASGYLAEGEY